MKKLRGYIFSRPFFNERAPQHIQNLVLRNYCKKNNFFFLLSFTEYRMKNSSLMLNSILKNIKKIDGIVFYSLFQMPVEDVERKKIFSRVLELGKSMYFSVEGMQLTNKQELERLENIWMTKKTLVFCPKNFNKK